jgi:hypothetical protein
MTPRAFRPRRFQDRRVDDGTASGGRSTSGRRRIKPAGAATGQPTLYLLCGKIAAGKSTLARRLAKRPYTVLIAEDHWNSNLFKEESRPSTTTPSIRSDCATPWARTSWRS